MNNISESYDNRSRDLLRAYFDEYVGGPFPGCNEALEAVLSRMDDFVQAYNDLAYGYKDVPALNVSVERVKRR